MLPQYSLDEPGYLLMDGVREVGDLTNAMSRARWNPVEKRVREKYHCSLAAFVFYRIWNEGFAVNEIAGELGVERQNLAYLTEILGIPTRSKNECYTPHVCRRMMREKKLDDEMIIYLYTQKTMGIRAIAHVERVSPPTIRNRLLKNKIALRNRGALSGRFHYRSGQMYEEYYGKRKADAIKKKMRAAWKRRKNVV